MENTDLEKLKDDSAEQFIKDFDEEFGSMLQNEIKNTPLLVTIFHDYIEQNYRTSKYYKTILKKIVDIADELYATFSEEQKLIFEKYQLYKDMLEDDTLVQSFIYGYCFNQQLKKEMKSKK